MRTLSIKTKLYSIVALSVLALVTFAGIDIYGTRQGTAALASVYEHQVEPTAALLEADRALKGVRFRMAGYLLDQLPAVGNRNDLQEARTTIPAAWVKFKAKTAGNDYSDEERALIELIDRNIDAIQPFFDKLDAAYALDEKPPVGVLLEDDWPFAIQATLLKPIGQLIPLQQAAVKSAYEQSVIFGERIIAAGIMALFVVTLVLLGLVGKLAAAITRPLGAAVTVAEKIADGDWGSTIQIESRDEIGQLLSALEHMREQVHSRQQRLETILDNAAEGIITFDRRGMIEGFNRAAENLFGWTEAEVIGTYVNLLIKPGTPETRDDYLEHFMRVELDHLIGHEGEVTARHKDGSTFPMALKISEMTLDGKIVYVALAADISERKALMDHLKRMAEHDGLTGLHNRSYFVEEVERAVERARRAEQSCGLLHIDLDNFKYVNDVLGHAAGDQLLIEVAGVLSRRARKSDLIARLGGDEFTVLLYTITAEQLPQAADAFRRALAEYQFRQGGEAVDIGCSIGAAMVTEQVQTAAQLMSHADIACHLAKRAGRNRVHVFRPVDAENVTAMSLDMGWSRRIRDAIENGRFALACQPIVDTRTHAIVSYEVLIRMLDEREGMIMPAGFLPPAERFGLAVDIDRWVIVHAIDTLAVQRRELTDLCYSINLSGQTLSDTTVCDLIQARIAATGLNPAALTFEVTETVAIADMAAAETFLARLQALGCRTALDDFGSGMSSFAYLRDLPVDSIKIDGRFVKNLALSTIDQAMVRAMNEIAHALGKQTVAEFVEDEASFRLLAAIGVDYAQGYHLGRPDVVLPCQAIAGQGGAPAMCRI